MAVQDLSNDIGVPYNLLWTIDGAPNGPALMSGALDVQQDGWVAWGFPQSPGSGMLGGSALLVKTDPGTPSGAQSATTVFMQHLDILSVCLSLTSAGFDNSKKSSLQLDGKPPWQRQRQRQA